MIKISIIIINHNYGNYLRNCIESCINQDTAPYEIIVVDDGSTDDSRSVIRQFETSVTAVFCENGGHVRAANTGFENSSGDVCIFLDADDFLYSNCLTQIHKLWTADASKVQYMLDTVDKNGIDQKMPFPNFDKTLDPAEIRRQSLEFGVYAWTVSSGNAYSRAYLEMVMPINANVVYRSPDGYLNKLAPLCGQVICHRSALGAYRVHGKNAWAHDGSDIDINRIVRWLKFDLVLQREFVKFAASRNIKVSEQGTPTFQQLESRALAKRFAPLETPYKSESIGRLFMDTLIAMKRMPNLSYFGRAAWVIWIYAILFMPSIIVKKIFSLGRGQIGRSKTFDFIVKKSRLLS